MLVLNPRDFLWQSVVWFPLEKLQHKTSWICALRPPSPLLSLVLFCFFSFLFLAFAFGTENCGPCYNPSRPRHTPFKKFLSQAPPELPKLALNLGSSCLGLSWSSRLPACPPVLILPPPRPPGGDAPWEGALPETTSRPQSWRLRRSDSTCPLTAISRPLSSLSLVCDPVLCCVRIHAPGNQVTRLSGPRATLGDSAGPHRCHSCAPL